MLILRLNKLKTRVATCKLYLGERELINRCDRLRLTRLYKLPFS